MRVILLGAILLALGIGMFAVPPCTDAQETAKVLRIGRLVPSSATASSSADAAFRQGLRELGWVVVINQKTAKTLGISLRPVLLLRADRVID